MSQIAQKSKLGKKKKKKRGHYHHANVRLTGGLTFPDGVLTVLSYLAGWARADAVERRGGAA